MKSKILPVAIILLIATKWFVNYNESQQAQDFEITDAMVQDIIDRTQPEPLSDAEIDLMVQTILAAEHE